MKPEYSYDAWDCETANLIDWFEGEDQALAWVDRHNQIDPTILEDVMILESDQFGRMMRRVWPDEEPRRADIYHTWI
jgi:hypothetical protein